ncbi:hypothetical protein D918_04284 [Trichuris suis]|nr:hypothetical protein D918_04284 [Trichuris suis]
MNICVPVTRAYDFTISGKSAVSAPGLLVSSLRASVTAERMLPEMHRRIAERDGDTFIFSCISSAQLVVLCGCCADAGGL